MNELSMEQLTERFYIVREQRDKLRRALQGLVGAKTKDELEQMEAGIRLVPAPDKDKIDALNAIHVLLEVENATYEANPPDAAFWSPEDPRWGKP